MATNDKDVKEVDDMTAEEKDAYIADLEAEQKSLLLDLFKEIDQINADAKTLPGITPGTLQDAAEKQDAGAEELKRMINTAFSDMENGVIDNDLIGDPTDTADGIPAAFNTALDGINEYLDGMNTRLEAALNADDPDEINRIYQDAQSYSMETGPKMAEQGLKGLESVINSLPPETREALQDFGILSLIKQLMLSPIEPTAESIEQQAGDVFAALDVIRQNGDDLLNPKTPEYFYSPINAIIREMDNLIDKGETDLVIANRGKPGEVTITTDVWTVGSLEGMEIEGKWEAFDRSVMDAVITLYKSGYRYISVDMIYRVMAVKRKVSDHPFKTMAEAIRKSVEHQRVIKVKCDLTREKEMREKGRKKSKHQIEVTDIGGELLDLFDVDFKIHGQLVHGWYIKHIPIMAWYSDQNGQTVSIKQEYRELITTDAEGKEKTAAVTKQRVAMNDYIWRYIEEVRNEHTRRAAALADYNKRREKDPTLKEKTIDDFCKLKRRMLYDTIIDAGGGKRSRQSDINNISFIKGRLLTLKNHKVIKDFRELPGNRIDTARGVEFDL